VSQLNATDGQVGMTYLAAGIAAAGGGVIGGLCSDRFGGRRTLISGWMTQVGVGTGFLLSFDHKVVGLSLIAFTTLLASLCSAASQALAAVLASPSQREAAFANLRIGQNVGFALGPPIGGALLLIGWPTLFLGLTLASAATAVVINALVPHPRVPVQSTESRRPGMMRMLQADPALLLLFAAGSLTMMVYAAESVLLPISLTQTHGMTPTMWGLLALVNPVLVVVLQIRVVHAIARLLIVARLATASLFMGLPFLLLTVTSRLSVILVTILLFVLGEVAWAPGAQNLMASIAPEGARGTYLGLFAATLPIGTALGPLIGLQARSMYGDMGMWASNAAVAVVAAVVYAAGGLTVLRKRRRDHSGGSGELTGDRGHSGGAEELR
jgi:predicted MFS family arabinose efflux permease